MKYIKTFESIKREPKIGDYVICIDNSKTNPTRSEKLLFEDYIQTHIGKIVKTDETHEFFVQYDEMPTDYEILDYAFYTTDRTIIKGLKFKELKIGNNTYSNITSFKREEIIFFSNNKKTIKNYIESNEDQIKFNL